MRSQPLEFVQGDDFSAVASITNGDGIVVDLTGFTAAAQIRRQAADSDSTVDATFTCTPSGSTVVMALAKAITVALSGAYVWDLQLTETATGLIRTAARGTLNVIPEVTRP